MKKTAYAITVSALCLWSHISEAIVKPKSTPFIRLEGALHHLHKSPGQHYLAFTDQNGRDLRVLELKTGKVYQVSPHLVGASSFFAPDGFRLFYREIYRTGTKVESRLLAYDLKLHQNVELERFEGPSGFLSFDPRELRFYLMREQGILSRAIVYPDERMARWQRARRKQDGRWLVAPSRALFLTHGGLTMRELADDGSGVQSFDISPDGSMLAWATTQGGLYISQEGSPPRRLDHGFDPKWHPHKPLIIYASPNRVGKRTTHLDIKITDLAGRARNLTRSLERNERWPIWSQDGERVFYTIENSTDLFIMDFEP